MENLPWFMSFALVKAQLPLETGIKVCAVSAVSHLVSLQGDVEVQWLMLPPHCKEGVDSIPGPV